LLFQLLDKKNECSSLYINGQFRDDYEQVDLTSTWAPTLTLSDCDLEYASIWARGKTLSDCCPEELKEEWEYINKRIAAFVNSFKNSKIDLDDVCFYDLLPENFLKQFCALKNKISACVFELETKPMNHDFMVELVLFLKKLESRPLLVNYKNLDMTNSQVRNIFSKVKNSPRYVRYNPWGTVTGRLTTTKNSFPILTLNKELRPVLQPKNDCFVELDFNAAELRVLFSLLGQDQPDGDIHEWIAANIFDNKYTRDQSKKKVFAWLYNPKAKNKKLNNYLNRDALYDKYYSNGIVQTPFARDIAVDQDKAVNYLIQSTTSDLFLTSAIEVEKALEGKTSSESFCIHDSLVIDYSKEDRELLPNLMKRFSDTKLGYFKTNLSMGKNFGTMRKIT